MIEPSNQKLKLLYILEMFRRESDEDHPISSNDIVFLLEKKGVTSERKSIYRDVCALREFGLDVIETRIPKRGWFLASREFELAEVRLLVDAVQNARFITPKKTNELTVKLQALVSDYQARNFGRKSLMGKRVKYSNEEILYSINSIHSAICNKKKISFKYSHRTIKNGAKTTTPSKEYVVSPFAMTWVNDHYYLIGNTDRHPVAHFRLDRIKKVNILCDKAESFRDVTEYKDFFDVSDYVSKSVNMFSGELIKMQARCGIKVTEIILDYFGDNVTVKSSDSDTFTFEVEVAQSRGLVSWIMSIETLEVLEPAGLREMIADRVNELNKIYSHIPNFASGAD